jgi:hypothetical protein
MLLKSKCFQQIETKPYNRSVEVKSWTNGLKVEFDSRCYVLWGIRTFRRNVILLNIWKQTHSKSLGCGERPPRMALPIENIGWLAKLG